LARAGTQNRLILSRFALTDPVAPLTGVRAWLGRVRAPRGGSGREGARAEAGGYLREDVAQAC
jgi:hypothetical protein